jgi:DNA-binding transcriptional ArsR family regulator
MHPQQEGEQRDLVAEERQGTCRPDDAEVAVPPDRVLKRMLHNCEGTRSDLAAQPTSLGLVTDRQQPEDEPVVLTDPRDIRALAHPARLTVLTELEPGVELTATELAARAGVTPSAMSYHLRALERAGIVRRADPRGDARERPWRMTGRSLRVEGTGPATVPAEELVVGTLLDRTRRAFGDWLRVQDAESPEWRDAATLHRSRVWLTVEEAAEVAQQLADVLEGYTERMDPALRPEGAREVELLNVLVPRVAAP